MHAYTPLALVLVALGPAVVRAQEQTPPAPTRPLSAAFVVSPDTHPCTTGEALADRVGRWLGRREVDADIELLVVVRDDSASFELRRAGEAPAHRAFEVLPRDCGARLDAVSLAIAIAIDPSVMERLAPPEAEALPSEPQSLVETTPDEPSEPGPLRFGGALGVVLPLAVLPTVAVGGTVAVELEIERLVEVRASALVTSSTTSPLGRGSVSMQLAAGRLDGCLGRALGRFRLGGCLGAAAGAVLATGTGFEEELDTVRPWVAVVARAYVGFPVDSIVSVRLSAEAMLPLLQARVHVMDALGVVLDEEALPPLGGVVSLEAVLRAP